MPPTTPDIRDIKPVVEVPLGVPWWLVALGVLVALAILAALVVWARRRRRPRAPAAPPEPVDAHALRLLAQAQRELGDDPEEAQRYYFRISEIVRAYVEARFALNATDLTTEEIAGRLAGVAEFPGTERPRLLALLTAADTVKFAKREPTGTERGDTYEQAVRFVTTTRPAPRASEAAAAPIGAAVV